MKYLIVSVILIFFYNNLLTAQNYTEILGRPTDQSITISLLFNQDAYVYWEYGISTNIYTHITDTSQIFSDIPLEYDLNNLSPNTKYYYRIRYKTNGNNYLSGPEHSFHTQRAIGSSFSFTIEADEHLYDKKGVKSIYEICLSNQALDQPDFMISMGDIFGDDHHPFQITAAEMDSLHKIYRPFLGKLCNSVPFYICLGNHEGENDYYLSLTPPNNIAIFATLSRKTYFPNPYPNSFYSGNTDTEGFGIGNPENYYSWTWGNALFVVMDVYRDQCDTSAKPKKWDWSIGLPQYTWLKNTLENSTSQYKFVFAHQIRGQGRGGILDAPFFEWGGYEADSTTWGFTSQRPGWAKPIHQLFIDNGVNIFFHGHDHLFSHEVLNNVVYQEVPMPSDSTYEIGMLANANAYASDTIWGTGHLRVNVTPACIIVDFVRAFLPADTLSGLHHNREVAFSYTIGNCAVSSTNQKPENNNILVYPNPASNQITLVLPEKKKDFTVFLLNSLGQQILQSNNENIDIINIPSGFYFLKVITSGSEFNKKIIINR